MNNITLNNDDYQKIDEGNEYFNFFYTTTGTVIMNVLIGCVFFTTLICCLSIMSGEQSNTIVQRNSRNPIIETNGTTNEDEIIEQSIKDNIMQKLQQYSLIIFGDDYDKIEECLICCELLHNTNIRVLPCFHKFHANCIDTWLLEENKIICPLCMQSIDMHENIFLTNNYDLEKKIKN